MLVIPWDKKSVSSIQKGVIPGTPTFNHKVIKLPASQKNRRGQFLQN
jgi:hypothetical protein